MEEKNLTDYNFWENYWKSKDNLIVQIPANHPFTSELSQLIENHQVKNLIEIGGFPGYYSIWATNKFGLNATLLDYFILPELVEKLKLANNCTKPINLITHDLFSEQKLSEKKYDLAFSNGLIEHFEDTKLIISKHIEFLKPNGQLFISLPNFRGLNGWFQKTFDSDNYQKHYIPCMDLTHLKEACESLNLKNIKVEYNGGFTIWLENFAEKPWWVRAFKHICWLPLKILFKLIPIETKYFSPYIIISAQK